MPLDQFTDQRHDAADNGILAVMAVGKERVVGDVEIVRVGPYLDDLAVDRKAAETGIENDNGGIGIHRLGVSENRDDDSTQSHGALELESLHLRALLFVSPDATC